MRICGGILPLVFFPDTKRFHLGQTDCVSIDTRDIVAAISSASVQANDDVLTVCAISLVAAILANIVHEGLGHAATALVTGTQSGVLTTVAWSSDFDSRLVAAGGTLANLAAAMVFWTALRSATSAAVRLRFFLLTSLAFNLFAGTGYFFFSGVTNFGDWAVVIAGLQAHWLWRSLLVVAGVGSYYGAVLIVGAGLVRYVGVPRNEPGRLRKLTFIPYFSTVLLFSAGGLLNPIGIQLIWQSALPASAGADSGLLWLRYYIPRRTVPERPSDGIKRNYVWITVAVALSLVFIFVLGRGIALHR
jgi:hypothetical protein